MTIGQSMLPEFDQEMKSTRQVLERVPDEKWDWKPHEKSGTLGWMAGHVATLPGFTVAVSTSSEYDVVTAKPLKVDKEADLVGLFIKMSGEARQALAGLSDEQFNQTWALKRNGQTIIAMPRYDMLRGMCLNHIIHHRGQLTMYLRELNVPVPPLYGPSADESPFG